MLLLPQPTASAIVVLVGCAATICDLRTRRIPNYLTTSTALAGLLVAATGAGLPLGAALVGLAVGAAVMLPGYALGTTGAGDVKLMAAFGAWLGPGLTVAAFLFAAVAGGLLAVAVAINRGRLRAAVTGAAQLAASPGEAAAFCAQREEAHRFAFGPAIAAGTAVALWWF